MLFITISTTINGETNHATFEPVPINSLKELRETIETVNKHFGSSVLITDEFGDEIKFDNNGIPYTERDGREILFNFD